ncbi:hypothetical protein RRG08_022662 [Elysia crispata]|uniref:Uncharacterized protein n=1 Tax=Elysia crispata TaxID=231223 RepID=A0AAE1D9E5_9GAST|nr:hypothetical protein RRG08_022662 [Elysia crispata]
MAGGEFNGDLCVFLDLAGALDKDGKQSGHVYTEHSGTRVIDKIGWEAGEIRLQLVIDPWEEAWRSDARVSLGGVRGMDSELTGSRIWCEVFSERTPLLSGVFPRDPPTRAAPVRGPCGAMCPLVARGRGMLVAQPSRCAFQLRRGAGLPVTAFWRIVFPKQLELVTSARELPGPICTRHILSFRHLWLSLFITPGLTSDP